MAAVFRCPELRISKHLRYSIACGINAGVDTCVLFTGEAQQEDLKDTDYMPDYQFETVRDLLAALK